MPFFAALAFPAQIGKLFQRYRGLGIANARALITAGAYQNDFRQLLGLHVPAAVNGPDYLAVIAPCIRIWIFLIWLIAVESQPGTFSRQMRTDERLEAFAMRLALDFIRHQHHRVKKGRGLST